MGVQGGKLRSGRRRDRSDARTLRRWRFRPSRDSCRRRGGGLHHRRVGRKGGGRTPRFAFQRPTYKRLFPCAKGLWHRFKPLCPVPASPGVGPYTWRGANKAPQVLLPNPGTALLQAQSSRPRQRWGLPNNIPRLLPESLMARVRLDAWEPQPIFNIIQKVGNIDYQEMYEVFNMGLGMVLICDHDAWASLQRSLPDTIVMGEVVKQEGDSQVYMQS